MENDLVTKYSGGGDPQRSIELLWGVQERPRRGPKPKLNVAMIVAEAIQLADTEGLTALAMRRIADNLGVATMSLYTYVPSKAELIDLMMDAVHGEFAPLEDDLEGGWRARLEFIAKANWALYHRHPWMLQVITSRPPLGPLTMAKYEYELGAVDGIGLTDLEMDAVIGVIGSYVQGAARTSDASQLVQRSGMTDLQWWEASAPVLARVVDGTTFPLGERVGNAAGEEYASAFDPARNFAFGLPLVLDGIEALVASRAS